MNNNSTNQMFGQSTAMAIPNANNGDSSQPINISFSRGNSFYQNPRLRRESIAHSQGMGGISWGSVTIGSWLKDEVMLHNQQQQQQNHGNNNANHFSPFMNSNKDTQNIASQMMFNAHSGSVSNNFIRNDSMNLGISPALNNSSYLADLEANYCKDYSCCGQLLPTLHDLLRHYEEMHIQQESTLEAPRARPINNAMGTVSTNEVFLTPQSSQQQTQPTIRSNATTNNNSLNQINSGLLQHQIPNNQNNLNSTLNNFTFNQSNGSQQQQQQNQSSQQHPQQQQQQQPQQQLHQQQQQQQQQLQQQQQHDQQQQQQQLQAQAYAQAQAQVQAQAQAQVQAQAQAQSQISHQQYQYQQQQPQQQYTSQHQIQTPHTPQPTQPSRLFQSVNSSQMRQQTQSPLSNTATPSHTHSEIVSQSRSQSHRSPQQFPMDEDEDMEDDEEVCIDDPSRRLYVMEQGENRPFKCPVIGCDKNYKNQNGLKYHRLHGHQNQTLRANPDGTYSVIDPESDAPYPDGMGMEKDKPYRCEVCGKRYKNLNGLKYHRGHSTH